MMEVITDYRVKEFLKTLSETDQGRVQGYIELFEQNGFILPGQYLKKIEGDIWELRPGKIRLLIGKAGTRMVVVNSFKKKTQKTPRKEIDTAKKRLEEYKL